MTRKQWSIILAFAAIYIIWGSTYLVILYAIKTIPPVMMSALRFLAAGLLLYGYALWKGEQQPDFTSFMKNALCGILMLSGGTVSVTWAEQYLPSSTAAIIVSSLPFWFVLLDRKQWSYYFSSKLIITGLLTGFIGVILLMNFKDPAAAGITSSKQIAGAVIIILGGIAWAAGSLFSKYCPARNSLLMNGAIQLLVAGFFCLQLSIFSGESSGFNFSQVHASSWLALLYLLVMGSLVTYLCYLWLLKVRTAAQVSTYVYVNPVVALLLGTVIAGENISTRQVLALLIILAGVLLINAPRYKRSRAIKQKNYPLCGDLYKAGLE